MLPGSSGASAPMGVQFFVRLWEMREARDGCWGVSDARPKRSAMLFASWGWRSVVVALSRKLLAGSSQRCV